MDGRRRWGVYHPGRRRGDGGGEARLSSSNPDRRMGDLALWPGGDVAEAPYASWLCSKRNNGDGLRIGDAGLGVESTIAPRGGVNSRELGGYRSGAKIFQPYRILPIETFRRDRCELFIKYKNFMSEFWHFLI